jgi:peroxiredoxin (alkyl hydroperoxide reductase subunit C)
MIDQNAGITGPILGEKAPFFEVTAGESTINLDDFRKRWLIIMTHPDDILPVFKTRTMKYLLCKRRITVIAVANGQPSSVIAGRNFVKRYIMKHSLLMISDTDGHIMRNYGLYEQDKHVHGISKGIFVIDPKGILRINLLSDASTERNFYEILRLVDMLQVEYKQKKKQTHVSKSCRPKIVLETGALSEEG